MALPQRDIRTVAAVAVLCGRAALADSGIRGRERNPPVKCSSYPSSSVQAGLQERPTREPLVAVVWERPDTHPDEPLLDG